MGEAGSKAVKSQAAKRSPHGAQRNAGKSPDFAKPVIGRRFAPTRLLRPGYKAGENYYGAGIDSRLEMLRPRMS